MNTDGHGLKHKEVTGEILGVFYQVYDELGHGFLESVYQKCLEISLRDAGLSVASPIAIPVWFRGRQVGNFEGDMLIDNTVLLELKAVRALDGSHQAQLLNYLRATEIEIG
ncbi:MAG TPA: GxxExxY protein, partial [Pyrinomonadaceae bacterium]|nr:GxxExxY protein [Pyrinomonadaceae bacterium]